MATLLFDMDPVAPPASGPQPWHPRPAPDDLSPASDALDGLRRVVTANPLTLPFRLPNLVRGAAQEALTSPWAGAASLAVAHPAGTAAAVQMADRLAAPPAPPGAAARLPEGGWARVVADQVVEGPGDVWAAIEDVDAGWQAAGEPERPAIGLSVEREGRQRVWLRRLGGVRLDAGLTSDAI
jgi:hypothetical protein